MAWTLTVDDFIFGSHRMHGEILAKGNVSHYAKTEDIQLMNMLNLLMEL